MFGLNILVVVLAVFGVVGFIDFYCYLLLLLDKVFSYDNVGGAYFNIVADFFILATLFALLVLRLSLLLLV